MTRNWNTLWGRPLAVGTVLGLLVAAGCAPDDQRTDTLDPTTAGRDLTPAAQAQLDSGNTAFGEEDYEVALAHYERVTELAPGHASGWFGIFMVYDATGDSAGADSAIARARSIAPGASLIRDTLPDDGPLP